MFLTFFTDAHTITPNILNNVNEMFHCCLFRLLQSPFVIVKHFDILSPTKITTFPEKFKFPGKSLLSEATTETTKREY